jgi:endonuclease/exonuclease/phosphatase family metal-dependent hydrolase
VRRLLILLALLAPVPCVAADLKIATWNLNWLTTREAGDPGLPPDVRPRAEDDFARLAQYAAELNADVVAIEEVDGWGSAAKLFPRDGYSIHMTRDHVTQRVGIVVRRGLRYDANPDVTALAENHLRSGADITLHLPAGTLRVLAVHLKKGCRDQPLARAQSQACRELRDQAGPLADWIAARQASHEAFIVLGDFNRWMDGKDSFLATLRQAAPLVRATEGHSSPCWGSESFIGPHPGRRGGGWLDADGHAEGDGVSRNRPGMARPAVRPLPGLGTVRGAGLGVWRRAVAGAWRRGCPTAINRSHR